MSVKVSDDVWCQGRVGVFTAKEVAAYCTVRVTLIALHRWHNCSSSGAISKPAALLQRRFGKHQQVVQTLRFSNLNPTVLSTFRYGIADAKWSAVTRNETSSKPKHSFRATPRSEVRYSRWNSVFRWRRLFVLNQPRHTHTCVCVCVFGIHLQCGAICYWNKAVQYVATKRYSANVDMTLSCFIWIGNGKLYRRGSALNPRFRALTRLCNRSALLIERWWCLVTQIERIVIRVVEKLSHLFVDRGFQKYCSV